MRGCSIVLLMDLVSPSLLPCCTWSDEQLWETPGPLLLFIIEMWFFINVVMLSYLSLYRVGSGSTGSLSVRSWQPRIALFVLLLCSTVRVSQSVQYTAHNREVLMVTAPACCCCNTPQYSASHWSEVSDISEPCPQSRRQCGTLDQSERSLFPPSQWEASQAHVAPAVSQPALSSSASVWQISALNFS